GSSSYPFSSLRFVKTDRKNAELIAPSCSVADGLWNAGRLGCELLREVEAREHFRRDEGGHLPDERSLEGEHSNRRRNETPRLCIEAVARHGRLSVGAGGERANLSARLVPGEASDHLAAPPPAPPRRHREDGVFCEQRGDRVDVASRPRLDVRLNEVANSRIAERAQGRLLSLLRKPLVDGLARTLQRAVHRGDARLEGLGR